jgi:archaellum component FlaC
MAINVPIVSEFNNRGLKKAMSEFKRLETTGQKTAFALKKAFVPATAALGGLAVAGAKMVAAGEQAATANARIEQIATSMGLFGAETEKVTGRLVDLANEQARLTGVDQNLIKESQALLLTFKDIASSADEVGGAFDRATQLTLDMASAGFGSVTDNAKQLGKALNDPIAGLTALRRSGIQFTKAQQDQIRTLVESGNVLEAQTMILEEIENQVGGTAAATANSTDKMKVAFSQASESIGMALLPAVEALLPIVIKFADWASQNTEIVIALAAAIGGLSAAIVVANFAMKAWAAAQAIATAAQWAFNVALTANPIGIVVVAVAALVAGLVLLYRRFESVRNIVKALLAPLKAAADGVGWLAKKLGIVGDEIKENFTPSVDEARKQAGDMYASVREASGGLEDLEDTADAAAGAQEDLARSVNAVYDNVKKLNPELVEMLRLLDVQDDIENLRTEFDNYNEVIAESSDNVRELQQAERDLTRAIIETLSAHGLLTLAFADELKIKIDTGDLDAAYASALRVLDAFNKVKQVSAGVTPSTYVPPRDELGFLSAPPVASTTITPVASITRAPSGAVQNVTVNVNTPTPTEEIGKVVVDSIRKYNRVSGSAAIGVLRL